MSVERQFYPHWIDPVSYVSHSDRTLRGFQCSNYLLTLITNISFFWASPSVYTNKLTYITGPSALAFIASSLQISRYSSPSKPDSQSFFPNSRVFLSSRISLSFHAVPGQEARSGTCRILKHTAYNMNYDAPKRLHASKYHCSRLFSLLRVLLELYYHLRLILPPFTLFLAFLAPIVGTTFIRSDGIWVSIIWIGPYESSYKANRPLFSSAGKSIFTCVRAFDAIT